MFNQGDRSEKAEAKTGSSGTYRVILQARGKDNFGNDIFRTFERAFQVYERVEFGNGDGDTDKDGMTDSWEVFYGTDPYVSDANDDKDFDELSNIEEFQYGTRPCDPDTDNGGAADGYEVTHGLCPLCPLDDPFPNLANVSVISTSDSHGNVGLLKPNSLLLQFPDDPNYAKMEIYRDTVPNFPCNAATLIETLDMQGPALVTSYYDEGLVDGQKYYYKLRALSLDGSAATPFSREVDGFARSDPAEPFGAVVLNSAQNKSDRLQLAVKLLPRSGATEYRLSDSPFTPADSYNPLPGPGAIVPFLLTDPSLGDGDGAKVYFQFRKPGGVSSRTNHVDITLDFSGDNDNDGSNDLTDPDDDNDGISDSDELFVHCTNPYSKDTDGDGYQDDAEIAAGTDPTDSGSMPDQDGDGYDDELETLLGSNPADSNSVPDINLEIAVVGNLTVLSFDTAPGILYSVHSRSELTNRVRDWPVVNGPIAGNGSRQSLNAPLSPNKNFYGVHFQLAPNP